MPEQLPPIQGIRMPGLAIPSVFPPDLAARLREAGEKGRYMIAVWLPQESEGGQIDLHKFVSAGWNHDHDLRCLKMLRDMLLTDDAKNP
jgi:hypothetical protein